ncbi:ATP-binding protein [Nonomuraea sp. NPDC049141]|uniref:ATP-binding protein n=1 Tax=Nonomuraea sp. NPDC049141 TaxID=3155500 RepID=UPI0033D99A9C
MALATEAASADRANEDFVGAIPNGVVVLDGAGYPPELQTGCRHSVAWYARTLGTSLLGTLGIEDGSLTDALARSIKAVASVHSSTCDLAHPGSPSAIVVALRRTNTTLEWLVLSDSVLVLDVDAAAEPIVITDERLDDVAADLRTHLTDHPSPSKAHGKERHRFQEALLQHRNKEDGYWVASTDSLAAEHALTGTMPINSVRAAAPLSDGASRLVDLFQLATWRQFMDILAADDPGELINQVRKAERTDPDGSRWPRSKATIGVAVYRIVQESLTNVIKHAAPAGCVVRVDRTDNAMEIEVTDDGRRAPTGHSPGHGLIGMRERVAVYGGEFTAGPLAGRGFRVHARLPLEGVPT